MNEIIYFGLPTHHYFSIEHSETFNSFLHKRMNNSFDSLDEVDQYDSHPLHLFTDLEADPAPTSLPQPKNMTNLTFFQNIDPEFYLNEQSVPL